MNVKPIGRVRSDWKEQKGTPVQSAVGTGRGQIEIDPAYRAALADLEAFDRVWILAWLDRAPVEKMRLVPYRDTEERGLFATRAPCRPNPIGLSTVTIENVDIEAGVIETGPIDLLDGTPVLDVKPYVPEFDAFPSARAGWLDSTEVRRDRADDRFEAK